MNTIGTSTPSKPLAQQSQDIADSAAGTAQNAIRLNPTRRRPGARSSFREGRRRAQPGRALAQQGLVAGRGAARGMEAVRDTSQQLRERAQQAQDMTVAYVKDEPIKAMLIAAATGALLMGLISLLGRSRD
jgi:ElaB/YqjD/DUF883 family membrane-anchored ribosome-binding protein